MRLFCECDHEWEIQGNDLTVAYMVAAINLCSKCRYNKWYEPYYENMMFDLKNMDQM